MLNAAGFRSSLVAKAVALGPLVAEAPACYANRHIPAQSGPLRLRNLCWLLLLKGWYDMKKQLRNWKKRMKNVSEWATFRLPLE